MGDDQVVRQRGHRRRTLRVGALLAACSMLGLATGVAGAHLSKTRVSLSGGIGSLKLNGSTRAEIVRRLGPPNYSMNGNIGHGSPPTPNYQLLGYGCTMQMSYTFCDVNYYINVRRHRLESFYTTSSAFVLSGGVHVGMSAGKAARIEREPDHTGCEQGIAVTTPRLSIFIQTRGGHAEADGVVAGGRVSGISIDHRPYGVGVGICL